MSDSRLPRGKESDLAEHTVATREAYRGAFLDVRDDTVRYGILVR